MTYVSYPCYTLRIVPVRIDSLTLLWVVEDSRTQGMSSCCSSLPREIGLVDEIFGKGATTEHFTYKNGLLLHKLIEEALERGSVVIDTNRQSRQSSILIDIPLSIYIDSCRLFIFFIQIISYFVSTINALLLVINTWCNFRNFYRSINPLTFQRNNLINFDSFNCTEWPQFKPQSPKTRALYCHCS
jgi:hypothetical protein